MTGPRGAGPGYYPDPWRPGGLRWWDGSTWTVAAEQAWYPPDPRPGLAAEQVAERWARIGIWGLASYAVLEPLVFLLAVRPLFRSILHSFPPVSSTSPQLPGGAGTQLLFLVLDVVSLGSEVMVMVWLHRAATFARGSGYPARLDPVWAVLGWIVPVVSLWFPHHVIADCLDPGDTGGRSLVLQWWLLFLVGSFAFAVLGLAGAFVPAVGVAAMVAGAGFAWYEGTTGIRMLEAVGADHRRRATSTLAAVGMA